MKKYELTDETIIFCGKTLYRIRALIDFGDVAAGDLGGYVESESNLSQDGNAWVSENAWVCGNAVVSENAWVSENAVVSENAWVCGNAVVSGNAGVSENARVSGNAVVSRDRDYACVRGFGRECRTTTFFRQADDTIGVVCGCFFGTLDEFREKVRETHGESKFAREYLMIADLMELHFGGEKND